MLIIQDNTETKIKYNNESAQLIDKINQYLYQNMAVDVQGAKFSPSFKRGYWDGQKHFYEVETQTFPTGLTSEVLEYLDKVKFNWEFNYEVIDNRPDRFITDEDIDDDITLYKRGEIIHLRDYQMAAVNGVFKSGQGGIVNQATGSGKSSVGAAIIQTALPKLQRGERILFFTNNKEIFNQNIENLQDALHIDIGYLGGGKKKISQVMVVMIPTANSYLKIDPEAGLTLSPKEQQIKKMVKIYKPKFLDAVNPYQSLVSFVNLYKPIKKVDYKTKEILEDIRDSCGSNKDVIRAFNDYEEQYNQIINKKSGDLVKKKKFITDLLDSAVLFIADECLTPDTQITMLDKTTKPISEIQVGDELYLGGKVKDLKKVTSNYVTLHYGDQDQTISGSLTHPLMTKNGVNRTATFKVMSEIKVGDYLFVPTANASAEPSDDVPILKGGYKQVKVTNIDYHDETQELYDIETETHVFVANGIVSHNCHHSKADTWYTTLLACHNAIYKVGLTGSIDKSDPVTVTRLKGVFGSIVKKVSSKELIDRGLLAKPQILMVPITEPKSVAVEKKWFDVYKQGIVENDYRNKIIASLARKWYSTGKTTLIIISQIDHSDRLSAELDALQVPHEVINGTQDDTSRKQELDNVKAGHNRVLIATSVLDEGVDISNIDTLILAAGGKSVRQVIQRVGRVLRKKYNKENKALIVDFIDRQNRYLLQHSKAREKIYREEQFDIKVVGE